MASEKPDSFQCGPFEVAANPSVTQFVDKLNKLREAVDQCRIQPGVGYTFTRSSGGTSLTIKNVSSRTAAETKHPFQVIVKKDTQGHSFYVNSGLAANITPNNVNTWISIHPPAKIYIEATFNEAATEFRSVTILSKSDEDDFSNVEISDGRQTKARVVIARFLATETSKKDYYVLQSVNTDLVAVLVNYYGYAAVVFASGIYAVYD